MGLTATPTPPHREVLTMADVCQDCYSGIRPDSYLPDTDRSGDCDSCGAQGALVARVSATEARLHTRTLRCAWLARCTHRATHLAWAGSAGVLPACDSCDPAQAPGEPVPCANPFHRHEA